MRTTTAPQHLHDVQRENDHTAHTASALTLVALCEGVGCLVVAAEAHPSEADSDSARGASYSGDLAGQLCVYYIFVFSKSVSTLRGMLNTRT